MVVRGGFGWDPDPFLQGKVPEFPLSRQALDWRDWHISSLSHSQLLCMHIIVTTLCSRVDYCWNFFPPSFNGYIFTQRKSFFSLWWKLVRLRSPSGVFSTEPSSPAGFPDSTPRSVHQGKPLEGRGGQNGGKNEWKGRYRCYYVKKETLLHSPTPKYWKEKSRLNFHSQFSSLFP